MFKLNEKVRHDEPDDRLEAARRVACILAVHKQPGFDDVLTYLEQHQKKDLRNWRKKNTIAEWDTTPQYAQRVRDALCILADPSIVPPTALEGASKCGGVPPGKNGYGPRAYSDEWPDWANPGNDMYVEVIDHVIKQSEHTLPHNTRQTGLKNLKEMAREMRGNIVGTYLAAADAAQKLEEHMNDPQLPWHREYKPYPGGVFHEYDEVSQYVKLRIENMFAALGPLQKVEKVWRWRSRPAVGRSADPTA